MYLCLRGGSPRLMHGRLSPCTPRPAVRGVVGMNIRIRSFRRVITGDKGMVAFGRPVVRRISSH